MAKDGTARGGPRPGTGPKKKPLYEKLEAGSLDATILPEPADLNGWDMPEIKSYMRAKQKNGKDLVAPQIYKETWEWLKARGCEKQVNPQLLEEYAMAVSRWIQCEEAISEYGFLAKHPTTGQATKSPYVGMAMEFQKQVNNCWFSIYQIVKDNCTVDYSGRNPQDNVMEMLLSRKINDI